MISIRQILSEAQNHFDDLPNDRIQLGEYLDMFNDVAMDIAEKSNAWIIRYEIIPKALDTDDDTNIAIIPYTDTALPMDLSTFAFMQILRDGVYANEVAYQESRNTYMNDFTYRNNFTYLTKNSFSTHVNPYTYNIELYFGDNFELGENVIVTLISNRPFGNPVFGQNSNMVTKWEASDNPLNAVPDFTRNAFRWGMIYRIIERLYNRGDESYTWRRMNAEKKYEKALVEVSGYNWKRKDRYSKPKLQPVNWFGED